MTEALQKAYDAYQQALVNLRDPKVSFVKQSVFHCGTSLLTVVATGPYAVVRNRYIVRPLHQL